MLSALFGKILSDSERASMNHHEECSPAQDPCMHYVYGSHVCTLCLLTTFSGRIRQPCACVWVLGKVHMPRVQHLSALVMKLFSSSSQSLLPQEI